MMWNRQRVRIILGPVSVGAFLKRLRRGDVAPQSRRVEATMSACASRAFRALVARQSAEMEQPRTVSHRGRRALLALVASRPTH
jgi:hypothetical protein